MTIGGLSVCILGYQFCALPRTLAQYGLQPEPQAPNVLRNLVGVWIGALEVCEWLPSVTHSLHLRFTEARANQNQFGFLGQNPNRTREHRTPTTKIGSKMGGEFTYQPKWDPKTVWTTTAIQLAEALGGEETRVWRWGFGQSQPLKGCPCPLWPELKRMWMKSALNQLTILGVDSWVGEDMKAPQFPQSQPSKLFIPFGKHVMVSVVQALISCSTRVFV